MEEHAIILQATAALQQATAQADSGKKPADALLVDLLDIISKFADKCHHTKEEVVLFPLIQAKDASSAKEISILLEDHRRGRSFIAALKEAVTKNDTKSQLENANGYANLIKAHIKSENPLFFGWMALLTAGEKERMFEAFEKIEEEVIGLGKHEEYVSKIKEIKSQLK